ncbi:putative membrane protein YttA [Sporosarcina sp. NCCP-2716]|uniref:sunset domain-containing protein n=1 Tax=Sporosarcina sp. NCCP-2716 TaxID=2943679 RepID=UPI00203AD4D7|nr:hypothetical protein [Sporosarcina sp. NCCP-2716]GKV70468.1 putative membrane protein YttA [Sporosarcina sp. NCCP-2716]
MGYAAFGLAVVLIVGFWDGLGSIGTWQRRLSAVAVIGLATMVLSGCGADQEQAQLAEKLEAKNAAITEANQTLKDELVSLQEENGNLKNKLQEQTDKQSSVQETVQTLQKEKGELTESIAALKEQNDKLTAAAGEKDKTIQQLKDKSAAQAAAPAPAAKGASSNTASGGSGGQSGSQSANTASAQTDCNIKGSNTGIYHVPGSTYYDRTKNVVQWFCSAEEAVAAGYRAPKR